MSYSLEISTKWKKNPEIYASNVADIGMHSPLGFTQWIGKFEKDAKIICKIGRYEQIENKF